MKKYMTPEISVEELTVESVIMASIEGSGAGGNHGGAGGGDDE